jgi:hypothetical protein
MVREETLPRTLREHASACAACQETLLVAAWMKELAAGSVFDAPLPDAAYLWWKAELLRRWDAQQRAAAPIERGERVQAGIVGVGVLALLALLWRETSRLAALSSPAWRAWDVEPVVAITFVSALLLLTITVVACRDLFTGERA